MSERVYVTVWGLDEAGEPQEPKGAVTVFPPDGSGAAVKAACQELHSACNHFPPFNSAHEGFAVLKEEVDELWEEVRGKTGKRSVEALRKEAVQVAAMALRFIVDVCPTGKTTT